MKYLATSGVSRIWDTSGEVVLLGPWCINQANSTLVCERRYPVIPHERFTREDWISMNDYCDSVFRLFMPQLSQKLNQVHSTRHPEKYWRILAGAWLHHYIQILYDRHRILARARQIYPDIYTHEVTNIEYIPRDTSRFINRSLHDLVNLKTFSLMAVDLGLKTIPIQLSDSSHVDQELDPPSLKDRVIQKFLQPLCGSSQVELHKMHALSLSAYIKLSVLMRKNLLGGLAFHNYGENDFQVNADMRRSLAIDENADPFVSILARYLPHFIPCTFIEGYEHLASEFSDKGQKEKVSLIISSTGWKDDRFRLYSAIQSERGTKLIGVQHGAYYGQSLRHWDRCEISLNDMYFSWGWDSMEGCSEKIYPMPSIHLSKLLNTHGMKRKALFYPSADFNLYRIRLCSHQDPGTLDQYFSDQEICINALRDDLQASLYYRPYPNASGRIAFEKIRTHFPQVRSAQAGKATSWLKESTCAIIDHPGTIMLEALAVNIPCILFWRPDDWPMRKEAEPDYDELRKSGILFDDPSEAAERINTILKNNPPAWWYSSEIQKVRNSFLNRYGYSVKNWEKVWTVSLRKLLQSERNH